jgi:hypothetical protein
MASATCCLLLSFGCGESPTAPTSPTVPPGTHQSRLSATLGTGEGGVSVSPQRIPAATFAANISIRIDRARPSTTYIVQRAPEIGRALASDGVCQRALGTAPWSAADPPAPAFVTFPGASTGSVVSVTTSSTGSASLDFEFQAPTIPAGTVFDVMFRLVDNESTPTVEIRSGCFTVTVL